jgi:hypothetical protein
MYYDTKEVTMMDKYTSVIGHFDGHGDLPEQYRWQGPMPHVQGYPGSNWTPPSGNYLLRIAPAATRATPNKTMTKKWTDFAGHFNGHGNAPVQYHMHCPMEEVQGFGRSHWMPPSGKYCGQYMQLVTHKPVFF